MRLRSSQFVFLLLLLGSVQLGEDFARQLVASAPVFSACEDGLLERGRQARAGTCFPAKERGVEVQVSRLMGAETGATTLPAAFAAAVAHHTGLLRA